MKVAVGAWRRVASSRLRVPFALTPKSVCGSDAAQSCDGCAGGVDHKLDRRRAVGEHAVDGAGVADVDLK